MNEAIKMFCCRWNNELLGWGGLFKFNKPGGWKKWCKFQGIFYQYFYWIKYSSNLKIKGSKILLVEANLRLGNRNRNWSKEIDR